MYIDGMIIMLGAISLLAYSTLLIPEIEVIVRTVQDFISRTVVKTAPLIGLLYIFLGLLANYILAYYQFQFHDFWYALLRSCIVYLNGFMLNEQTIILSRETVMNLISYNGFVLTFFKFVISNIVIRQVIINVVAILMHNDYHNAKIAVAQ